MYFYYFIEILEQAPHQSCSAHSRAALINFSAPCAALNRGRRLCGSDSYSSKYGLYIKALRCVSRHGFKTAVLSDMRRLYLPIFDDIITSVITDVVRGRGLAVLEMKHQI